MSVFVATFAAVAAFLGGGILAFVYLGLTDKEADAIADAVLEFQKKYGTKNPRSYRLDRLLERHARLNAVDRRRLEVAAAFTLDAAESEALEWAESAAANAQHPAESVLRGLRDRHARGGEA